MQVVECKDKEILFAPTVYEHLSKISGETVSELAQNGDKLLKALTKMMELYEPDIISLGIDVYNIEAEALGAKVNYFEDNSLPELSGNILSSLEELDKLESVNFLQNGRIGMMLNVAKDLSARVKEKNKTLLCAVTGPFTLAAILYGFENLAVDMLTGEDIKPLLCFTEKICYEYAKALYEKSGCDIVINESYITPPLLSKEMYEEYAFPAEKNVIEKLEGIGVETVSLIAGGNTELIIESMLKTGTNLVMADANCEIKKYIPLCEKYKATLRANVASADLESGNFEKIENDLKKLCIALKNSNVSGAIGAGIVSKNTPIENVLKFKDIFEKINN